MTPLAIIAVNVAQRIAVLDDGSQVRVTNLIDIDGDETNDGEEAVVFVAGPDRNGKWHTEMIEAFTHERHH